MWPCFPAAAKTKTYRKTMHVEAVGAFYQDGGSTPPASISTRTYRTGFFFPNLIGPYLSINYFFRDKNTIESR